LNLVDLPKSLSRARGKDVPKFAAHIKGPKGMFFGSQGLDEFRTNVSDCITGEMTLELPSFLTVNHDAATLKTTLSVLDPEVPAQRAMWGTIRALLQNHITGVSEGHICVLSLVGVGYRATIEDTATTVTPSFPGQKFVSLKVGFSHPIELGIPEGVQASTPQPTRILLESVDKRAVTQFAAEIREWRRPEPYKGKGIFVNGETIKLKAKKIK
jgi:large subunit ribosomal protein L6